MHHYVAQRVLTASKDMTQSMRHGTILFQITEPRIRKSKIKPPHATILKIAQSKEAQRYSNLIR